MNKGLKIGLYVAGGLAVVTVVYLAIKNSKITKATHTAEAQGFKCTGCLPSKVKVCTDDAGRKTQVDCSYYPKIFSS